VLLPSGRIFVWYNVKFIEDEATGLGEDSDDDHKNDTGAYYPEAKHIDPAEDEKMHPTEENRADEDDSAPDGAPPKKAVRVLLPNTRAPFQTLLDGYAHIASVRDGKKPIFDISPILVSTDISVDTNIGDISIDIDTFCFGYRSGQLRTDMA
jgi:hypothetical protein